MQNRNESVLTPLEKLMPTLEDLYRHFHANPELSMQEVETAQVVSTHLAAEGFEVRQVGGGVVGTMKNGDGPTVLFRADMDALPVREESGLDYAAGGDVMHACGHDMHITAGLGAATLLARAKEQWAGTYIALFQPGEETGEGARAMVEARLADDIPRPDVALAQHVLATPLAGHVATTAGPALSGATSLRITVFGRGSHGSMPHLGIDPVVLAAAIVMRLQAIVSRELAPGEFGVVSVGSIQAGQSANVIPDSATLLINTRAYSAEVQATLLSAIERIVRAECVASGSPREPVIETIANFPLTENDPAVTATVTEAFRAHFGDDRVHHMEPATASEDFSNIPDAFGTPYTYWGFGGFASEETAVANHNPRFAPVIHPTLRTGTEAAAIAALACLR